MESDYRALEVLVTDATDALREQSSMQTLTGDTRDATREQSSVQTLTGVACLVQASTTRSASCCGRSPTIVELTPARFALPYEYERPMRSVVGPLRKGLGPGAGGRGRGGGRFQRRAQDFFNTLEELEDDDDKSDMASVRAPPPPRRGRSCGRATSAPSNASGFVWCVCMGAHGACRPKTAVVRPRGSAI
jgi:hypothetical protein